MIRLKRYRQRVRCFFGLHEWRNFGTVYVDNHPHKPGYTLTYSALVQRCDCDDCWATRFL